MIMRSSKMRRRNDDMGNGGEKRCSRRCTAARVRGICTTGDALEQRCWMCPETETDKCQSREEEVSCDTVVTKPTSQVR